MNNKFQLEIIGTVNVENNIYSLHLSSTLSILNDDSYVF
jgi:hypothetical protein